MAAAKKIPEFQHAIESDSDWSETIKNNPYAFVEFHQSWAGPVRNVVTGRHYMQHQCAQVRLRTYLQLIFLININCTFLPRARSPRLLNPLSH